MERATHLQFYYVIADPKVAEQHVYTNFCKCNSFQVITNLLNSDNLKIAIAHLLNKLHFCKFTLL